MQYPQQNMQRVHKYHPQERRNFVPRGNMQQIEEEYEEERREYIPQQNIQKVKGMYPEERRGGYVQQTNKNIQNMQGIYQEQRREGIPRQNIFIEESENIPQQGINQREERYQVETRQYSQKSNNNMNFPPGFCPIHGIHRIKFDQQFEAQSQNKQEGIRNDSQQQKCPVHDEMEGIIGEIDNYKFYESKSIRNKKEDPNPMSIHYSRGGEEKEVNNSGGNNYVRAYIATRSIPTGIDSNYQQYQSFSQTSSTYNNYVGQPHIHSQDCPIHGKQSIYIQQQP